MTYEHLGQIALLVFSALLTGVGAMAVWLFKRHLVRIEQSLETIASHTTSLAVLDTRLRATERDVHSIQQDMRAQTGKLDQLLRLGGPVR